MTVLQMLPHRDDLESEQVAWAFDPSDATQTYRSIGIESRPELDAWTDLANGGGIVDLVVRHRRALTDAASDDHQFLIKMLRVCEQMAATHHLTPDIVLDLVANTPVTSLADCTRLLLLGGNPEWTVRYCKSLRRMREYPTVRQVLWASLVHEVMSAAVAHPEDISKTSAVIADVVDDKLPSPATHAMLLRRIGLSIQALRRTREGVTHLPSQLQDRARLILNDWVPVSTEPEDRENVSCQWAGGGGETHRLDDVPMVWLPPVDGHHPWLVAAYAHAVATHPASDHTDTEPALVAVAREVAEFGLPDCPDDYFD